jgi:hypothetical protein
MHASKIDWILKLAFVITFRPHLYRLISCLCGVFCAVFFWYTRAQVYSGTLIGNCGYVPLTAEGAIGAGAVDLIAFGRAYVLGFSPEKITKNQRPENQMKNRVFTFVPIDHVIRTQRNIFSALLHSICALSLMSLWWPFLPHISPDCFSASTSYIANPDLVERITNDWPLASAAYHLFYRVEGDDQSVGLTDFPVYAPPAAGGAASQ